MGAGRKAGVRLRGEGTLVVVDFHGHTAAHISHPPSVRRAAWVGLGVLILCAVAILLAFLSSHRAATPPPNGRLVDAGPASAFHVRQPKAFSKDDFFLIRLDDGSSVALYIYPPGYFGHAQGCTIRWDVAPQLNETFDQTDMWTEGCSGSLWDPSGRRLFGPTRDLDRFAVTLRAGHVFVDTRQLQCTTESPSPYPCERAAGPVMELFVTVTSSGFQPSRLEIPAGKRAYVILKNDTDEIQSWHLVGVPDAADDATRWPPPPIALLGASFAGDNDIHVVVPPGGQLGRPFTIGKRGTYTFQSDTDPARLRGTVAVH